MDGVERLAGDIENFGRLLVETRVDVKELTSKLEGINNSLLIRIVQERDHVALIYLSKEVFETVIGPIRKIVYGMVGIVLVSVISAILVLVLTRR